MFRNWTARIVLVFLTLEVGLLCSLYTGDIPLLRRAEETIFQTCLSWVRDLTPGEAILETAPEADRWQLRPLVAAGDEGFDWSLIEVPLASELFDGTTPNPAEYAVLLAKLHQAGAREVAFTNDLFWEAAPEIELVALDSALRPFHDVLLPVPLSEVPYPATQPAWLQASLIPRSALIGDASSLPIVNQVTFPPAISTDDEVIFAFTDFGGRDLQFRSGERLPLLARWEEGFIASWALQIAMKTLGVAPEELVVEPGRHLRLGADGPAIPIDDFGRAKLAKDLPSPPPLAAISAKKLFPLSEGDLPELGEKVILMSALDAKASQKSERLLREARSLLTFPAPGTVETFRRLSRTWEVLLYLEIALVGIFALHVRSVTQLIALAVLCGGLFVFVIGFLDWKGLWTPILPLAAAITMSWCLVGYLQQIAHPVIPRKKRAKSEATPSV